MTASVPEATPVRRGEIWWVNLDPAQGSEIRKTRPAIVVTANALNRARRTVVVVPLSTGPQPRPPIIVSIPSRTACVVSWNCERQVGRAYCDQPISAPAAAPGYRSSLEGRRRICVTPWDVPP